MNSQSDPSPESKIERDVLIYEHGELVNLFIHEDSMAWKLTIGLLAANAALAAGAYKLGFFDPSQDPRLELYVIVGLGVLFNIIGFFILQRSKIHRLSRLYRGYTIESRLRALGFPVAIFSSAEGLINREVMLKEPDGMLTDNDWTTRPLRWYEKQEALDLRFMLYVLAGFFFAAIVWLVIGRPWI